MVQEILLDATLGHQQKTEQTQNCLDLVLLDHFHLKGLNDVLDVEAKDDFLFESLALFEAEVALGVLD